MGVGVGAGVISGMLGVGGGVVMVPAMNLLMRVPVKAAVGTSTFMVGITSVATAFVFYSRVHRPDARRTGGRRRLRGRASGRA